MKTTALAIIALTTSLLSGTAFAQAYVGAAVGSVKADIDCAGTISCDNSSSGFKLIGGYKFTPNIAAELSYFDFGKAKARVNLPPVADLEMTAKAFALGVAFSGNFNPSFYGVARLGVANVKAEVAIVGAGSDSATKTHPYFGLGVGYRLSKALSVDLAADFSKAEYAGEQANLRMLSVGLNYAF